MLRSDPSIFPYMAAFFIVIGILLYFAENRKTDSDNNPIRSTEELCLHGHKYEVVQMRMLSGFSIIPVFDENGAPMHCKEKTNVPQL